MTAIILAGGRSSRMGENKALMMLEGGPVISRVYALMASVFDAVSIIADECWRYEFLHAPIYPDLFPDAGPLAGVHAGLVHAATDRNFVIACDLPFMSAAMVTYLASWPTARPITVASTAGFVHHLCGVYHRSCASIAERLLLDDRGMPDADAPAAARRRAGMHALCAAAGAEVIEADTLPCYAPDLFFNMNTREDYFFVNNPVRFRS